MPGTLTASLPQLGASMLAASSPQLAGAARRELRSSSGPRRRSPRADQQFGASTEIPAPSRIRLAACVGDDLRHKPPPRRAASRTRQPAPSRLAPDRASCGAARVVVACAIEPRRGSGPRRSPHAWRSSGASPRGARRGVDRGRAIARGQPRARALSEHQARSRRPAAFGLVTRGMLAWDPSRGAVTPTSRGAASPRGSTERPVGRVEPRRADARPASRNNAPRTLRLA